MAVDGAEVGTQPTAGAGSPEATQPAQRDGSSAAQTPPTTPPTTDQSTTETPTAEDAGAAAAQPETLTFTREEYERDFESRFQKGLTKAQRDWERKREQRDADRQAEAEKQAKAQERARARALWKKWRDEKDADAGTELIDLLGAPLEQEVSEEAYADKLEAARTETRKRIWEQHARSFGLDPEDEEVVEVLAEAKDFKALNVALLGLAKDAEAVDRMWAHPEIQKRHKAALETTRAAATINGQASVIGDKKVDISSGSGSGRPQTPDEVIADYAQTWARGQRPSAELTEAYRKVTGRAQAPPLGPGGVTALRQ